MVAAADGESPPVNSRRNIQNGHSQVNIFIYSIGNLIYKGFVVNPDSASTKVLSFIGS